MYLFKLLKVWTPNHRDQTHFGVSAKAQGSGMPSALPHALPSILPTQRLVHRVQFALQETPNSEFGWTYQ